MKSHFISSVQFNKRLLKAKEHIDVLTTYLNRGMKDAIFYEFGAGWNMLNPLAFFAFGVNYQIVIDIRYLLRPKLLNDVIKQFHKITDTDGLLRKPSKFIGGASKQELIALLKKNYGIDYRAPQNAGHTGIDSGSIDCITSTNTLEHIPFHGIHAILEECHRILKEDGLMSFKIDYKDHYSYFDRSVSNYNFLKYSDKAWAIFNTDLHYQNRLRHMDYERLLKISGFDIIEERRVEATEADLKAIEQLQIDKMFRDYTLEELSVRSSHIILRKSTPLQMKW